MNSPSHRYHFLSPRPPPSDETSLNRTTQVKTLTRRTPFRNPLPYQRRLLGHRPHHRNPGLQQSRPLQGPFHHSFSLFSPPSNPTFRPPSRKPHRTLPSALPSSSSVLARTIARCPPTSERLTGLSPSPALRLSSHFPPPHRRQPAAT